MNATYLGEVDNSPVMLLEILFRTFSFITIFEGKWFKKEKLLPVLTSLEASGRKLAVVMFLWTLCHVCQSLNVQ